MDLLSNLSSSPLYRETYNKSVEFNDEFFEKQQADGSVLKIAQKIIEKEGTIFREPVKPGMDVPKERLEILEKHGFLDIISKKSVEKVKKFAKRLCQFIETTGFADASFSNFRFNKENSEEFLEIETMPREIAIH